MLIQMSLARPQHSWCHRNTETTMRFHGKFEMTRRFKRPTHDWRLRTEELVGDSTRVLPHQYDTKITLEGNGSETGNTCQQMTEASERQMTDVRTIEVCAGRFGS
jgi:hypothetical protein